MALPFFKSRTEETWDRFSHAMNSALADASAQFIRDHNRRIALGSPVKVAEDGGDIIRVPIEVRGGVPQYAVAYLIVKDINRPLNRERIRQIAEEAVRIAEPYATTPPKEPGAAVLTYP